VDWTFGIIFGTELNPICTLVDQRGNIFKVSYNMDLHNPLIVYGYDEMHNLYTLKEGSHQILFRYVEESCFDVTIVEDTLSEDIVVDFFLEIGSRSSLTYHVLVYFTLTMTVSQCKTSHLVFFYIIDFRFIYILNILNENVFFSQMQIFNFLLLCRIFLCLL